MKINKNERVMCNWCFKDSSLEEWDNLTYSRCSNREMKRDYTHLDDSKAFLRKSNTFYLCPKCNKWSRGCQLRIVNTDNKLLSKLGGESIIEAVIHKD